MLIIQNNSTYIFGKTVKWGRTYGILTNSFSFVKWLILLSGPCLFTHSHTLQRVEATWETLVIYLGTHFRILMPWQFFRRIFVRQDSVLFSWLLPRKMLLVNNYVWASQTTIIKYPSMCCILDISFVLILI